MYRSCKINGTWYALKFDEDDFLEREEQADHAVTLAEEGTPVIIHSSIEDLIEMTGVKKEKIIQTTPGYED